MRKRISMILIIAMMALVPTACGSGETSENTNMSTVSAEQTQEDSTENTEASKNESTSDNKNEATATANVTSDGMIDATDMFTERDLQQTADTSEAKSITLKDGEDITISEAGVYVVSGSSKNATIYVEAGDEDKVQIVLDGVSMTNEDMPCIYVKSGDKVFVTTTGEESSLSVTGDFKDDGDTNLDAVIFSKEDLVLNGTGTLNITSSDNAVTSKDTLKVTGGNINIDCSGSGLEAHDAIEIADGNINITNSNDGLHAEDNDDDSVGYIYICGGTFNINAKDDAIHATTIIQIDGGDYTLVGGECIEGTYIQINDGNIDITASDDGINAAHKSSQYNPTFEMNGGNVTISMGAGDTDGVDSNGDIIINGGTISVTGQSTFDYDGNAQHNGGTIIVNGEETDEIPNQMMGGEGGPGMDGQSGPGMNGQGGPGMNGQGGPGMDGQGGFGPGGPR